VAQTNWFDFDEDPTPDLDAIIIWFLKWFFTIEREGQKRYIASYFKNVLGLTCSCGWGIVWWRCALHWMPFSHRMCCLIQIVSWEVYCLVCVVPFDEVWCFSWFPSRCHFITKCASSSQLKCVLLLDVSFPVVWILVVDSVGVGAVLVGGAFAVVVVSSGENKICKISFMMFHQRMVLGWCSAWFLWCCGHGMTDTIIHSNVLYCVCVGSMIILIPKSKCVGYSVGIKICRFWSRCSSPVVGVGVVVGSVVVVGAVSVVVLGPGEKKICMIGL